MFRKLIERILPSIIGIVVHKHEILTKKEKAAQEVFVSKLVVEPLKTSQYFAVGLIGLVGSGKSSVAHGLAKQIGATVISGDEIRIELRKQGERYERARLIAENAMIEVIKRGGNVILDSDFISASKRASLREKARKGGATVIFICTYADLDVMIGRALSAEYDDHPEDFFGGADSKWKGTAQSKGAVVKIREMLRRLPLHYRWENKDGGGWVIKNPPCKVLADIDTTDPDKWKREIAVCADRLRMW